MVHWLYYRNYIWNLVNSQRMRTSICQGQFTEADIHGYTTEAAYDRSIHRSCLKHCYSKEATNDTWSIHGSCVWQIKLISSYLGSRNGEKYTAFTTTQIINTFKHLIHYTVTSKARRESIRINNSVFLNLIVQESERHPPQEPRWHNDDVSSK